MTTSLFDDLNNAMLPRLFSVNPDMASTMGAHQGYDHLMPHGGVQRLDATILVLDEWLRKAEEIAVRERLTRDQRISLGVLRMAVNTQKFARHEYPLWMMHPDALEWPGVVMFTTLHGEYAPYEERIAGVAARIGGLPKFLAQFRERFKPGKPILPWTESAIETAESFDGFLKQIQADAAQKAPKGHSMRLAQVISDASPAIKDHIQWLHDLKERATNDFAMGRERFEKFLKLRGFEMSSSQLLTLAETGLSELKSVRMRHVVRMTDGGTLEDAYNIIFADSPETFEEVVAETNAEVASAKEFILQKELATVPDGPIIRVVQTPEFLEGSYPSAALFMPALFDRRQDGIYIVTRPKNEADLRQDWNRAMIINTSVHEAYPGHFHQGTMSNRRPWPHHLLHFVMHPDALVTAYETQEGWAHYCEKMMFDNGYKATDAAAVVMLDAAIWRACRVIYDIKLHFGEATIEEMATMLRREANATMNVALTEVSGFSRTPGYPISYFAGRHMVMELRRRLEAELGSRFNDRRFNDLIALNGNLPFCLAREVILDEMRASVRRGP